MRILSAKTELLTSEFPLLTRPNHRNESKLPQFATFELGTVFLDDSLRQQNFV
ncbi:hypothetical protein VIBNISFn27_970042 [Vibrio nigripulchritudo SFn27]|uniref:Uncharacterized protein n=1 Tax=Vibrio nigripulchritudo TaxID=28173 RepID=U4KH24_9VIBR|nr:hypothetical protein VIBNIAM115_1050051 [Vibrio nigripulchritudo AM115]CCN40391.1 hypothetical protein VIBNIFTn2_1240041 [Vibrio nigripulchritudo FTn2]CCN65272.1 hypothetical protein VIBNIPon4_370027 [Vibrio nigripulchritudo POn4]CCN68639.1 hypothetical protein VIBNISFn118_1080024 [Vibrio nigripulchritudo SFn118]CCN77247.1 hypothetical protein VIBNISO65_220027 [Vibrio nigripulchritudo SO65]CCN81490.1 hypothetical protein VIBNIBLFn1_240042 [Vibrio nigripulchritudo BLFn1]CCN91586.1 hypotheti